jgi:YtkA-like
MMRAMMVLFVSFAAACVAPAGDAASTSGASTDGAGGSEPSICADDPRGEPYHPGLAGTAADAKLTVRIVDSNPSPPTRGNNTFRIAVTDADGKPVDGATIRTTTWMPDHGHGSAVEATSRADGSPGEYVIDPVDLFMPGIWQITFFVSKKGRATDSVEFTFCIDG